MRQSTLNSIIYIRGIFFIIVKEIGEKLEYINESSSSSSFIVSSTNIY